MSDQVFWFATRAAGILAWFAATLSLGVGLLMSSRVLGRRPTLPWLLDVHRFLGAMAVVFLGVHLFTLWADSFVTLTVADLIVPGRATVPGLGRLSIALGVVAGWLLVLVEASSLIKNYLPEEYWHTVHLTSYGTVGIGLVHALQVGSDTDNRVLIVAAVTLLAAIVLLTLHRVSGVLSERKYQYEVQVELGDSTGRRPGPRQPVAAGVVELVERTRDDRPASARSPSPKAIGAAPGRVRALPPTHRSQGPAPSDLPDEPPATVRPGSLAASWAGRRDDAGHAPDRDEAAWDEPAWDEPERT